VAFWKTKIEKNRARDDEIASVLRADGWKILTLWQCEIKNIEELESKLYGFIEHE
jgi:DNA mismatch endonuclease (patch repair protein)